MPMTVAAHQPAAARTPGAAQPVPARTRRPATAAPAQPSLRFVQLTQLASFCLLAATFWGCGTPEATDTVSAPPIPDKADPKADSALQNDTPEEPYVVQWDFVQNPGTVPIEEDCFQHPECAVDESTSLKLFAAYGELDKPIRGTPRNLAAQLAAQEHLGLRFDGNKSRPYWYQHKVLGLEHLTSEDGVEQRTRVYGGFYANGQPEVSGPLVFVNQSTGVVRVRFHEEQNGFPICTSAYIHTPPKQ